MNKELEQAAKEFQLNSPLAKTLLTDYFIEGAKWRSAHLIKALKSELSTEVNNNKKYYEGYNGAIQDIITLIEQTK